MFYAVTIIHFKDGGGPEISVLHTGTKDECESVRDNTDAVAYSGSRPVERALVAVIEDTPDYMTLTERFKQPDVLTGGKR